MVLWWQCVKIGGVFEFTVFAAWWERSLELKLLSTHFMQDTAPSEAQFQTAEDKQCASTSPCLPPWCRFFMQVSLSLFLFLFPSLCLFMSGLFFCFIWNIVPSTPFSAAQVSPFVSELDFCLHCESQGQSIDYVHALSMAIVLISSASTSVLFKYSEVAAASPFSWHSHYEWSAISS